MRGRAINSLMTMENYLLPRNVNIKIFYNFTNSFECEKPLTFPFLCCKYLLQVLLPFLLQHSKKYLLQALLPFL